MRVEGSLPKTGEWDQGEVMEKWKGYNWRLYEQHILYIHMKILLWNCNCSFYALKKTFIFTERHIFTCTNAKVSFMGTEITLLWSLEPDPEDAQGILVSVFPWEKRTPWNSMIKKVCGIHTGSRTEVIQVQGNKRIAFKSHSIPHA
jgi:hypothetical protein